MRLQHKSWQLSPATVSVNTMFTMLLMLCVRPRSLATLYFVFCCRVWFILFAVFVAFGLELIHIKTAGLCSCTLLQQPSRSTPLLEVWWFQIVIRRSRSVWCGFVVTFALFYCDLVGFPQLLIKIYRPKPESDNKIIVYSCILFIIFCVQFIVMLWWYFKQQNASLIR